MEMVSTGLFIASLGMAAITAGLIGAASTSFSPTIVAVNPYVSRFLAFTAALCLSSFFLSRFYRQTRSAKKSVLVGKSGIVMEDHDAKMNLGKVRVDGLDWISTTLCQGITVGETVVVSDVRNAQLVVTRKSKET